MYFSILKKNNFEKLDYNTWEFLLKVLIGLIDYLHSVLLLFLFIIYLFFLIFTLYFVVFGMNFNLLKTFFFFYVEKWSDFQHKIKIYGRHSPIMVTRFY